MKIAVFTDSYLPQVNGVVTYLSNSIRLLSKNNEVVLFAPGSMRLRVERPSKNLKIYWIPAVPFPFYEGYRISSVNYKRVSGLLDRERPDIVHAHAPVVLGLQGMIAAKRRKIPVVATYHTHFPDYLPHLLNGKLPAPFSRISDYTVKKMIKHAFRLADAVTAPTHELVRELRSYGVRNAVYLPNGVDLKSFKSTAKKKAAFRKRYRIPSDKKVVLYLGRVSFEKKLDLLLKAFKMIEDDSKVLVIAGAGPYVEGFRNLAEALELENVVFTGYLKDITAAYACADIFVSPCDCETFGLTFIEAMHMGLPVIGVRRLGPKELIEDGKNGLLVKPGSIRGLAKAMERLLGDARLRRRIAKGAKESSKRYSLENSVGRTLKLYRRLAKVGRST
jgi:glycosyltransferase involved in cell wall biosynthesis